MSSRAAPRATRSRGVITRVTTEDVVHRFTTAAAGPSRAIRTRSSTALVTNRAAVTSPPRKAPASPRRRTTVKPSRANPLDFRPRSPPHLPRPAAAAADNVSTGTTAWAAQLQVSLRKEASARTGRESERQKSVIERTMYRTRVGKRAERELRSASREKEVEKTAVVSPVRERLGERNSRTLAAEKQLEGHVNTEGSGLGEQEARQTEPATVLAQAELSSAIDTSTAQRTLHNAKAKATHLAEAIATSPIVESFRTPICYDGEDLPQLPPLSPFLGPASPSASAVEAPVPRSSPAVLAGAVDSLAQDALDSQQSRRVCSELHNQGGQSQFEDAALSDEDDVMAYSSSQAVPGYSQQQHSIQGSHQRARFPSRAASNASSTRPLKRARIARSSDENGSASGCASQLPQVEEVQEVQNGKSGSDSSEFEPSSQAQRHLAMPMQSSNLGPRRGTQLRVRIAAPLSSQSSSAPGSHANSLASIASVSLMRTGTTQLPPGALFPFWDFDRGQSQAVGLGLDSETQSDDEERFVEQPEPSLAELMRPVMSQKDLRPGTPPPPQAFRAPALDPVTPQVERGREAGRKVATPAPLDGLTARTTRVLALDTPVSVPATVVPSPPLLRQAWLLASAPPSRASVSAWLAGAEAEAEPTLQPEQRGKAFAQAWASTRNCQENVSGSQSVIDDGSRAVPVVIWRGRNDIDTAYFPTSLPAFKPRCAPPSRAEVTKWASSDTVSSPPAPAQRGAVRRFSAAVNETTLGYTRDSLFDSRVAANVPWDDSLVWRGTASLAGEHSADSSR